MAFRWGGPRGGRGAHRGGGRPRARAAAGVARPGGRPMARRWIGRDRARWSRPLEPRRRRRARVVAPRGRGHHRPARGRRSVGPDVRRRPRVPRPPRRCDAHVRGRCGHRRARRPHGARASRYRADWSSTPLLALHEVAAKGRGRFGARGVVAVDGGVAGAVSHRRPRASPLRHPPPRARDGHPQPHARLVLRPGPLLRLRRVPRQGRAARRRGGRLPRRRRGEGRARARRSPPTRSSSGSIPAVEALQARFDVPLSVDTWRASVLREALAAGAVVGNDISGFADPDYLPVAAAAGASVVATHIRIGPRVPDPEPVYDEPVVDAVCRLPPRPGRGRRGGGHPPRAGDGRRRARPRQDRAAVAGAAARATTGWRRSAGRCSSRRRTSGSSATWSAPRCDDRREASHAAHALGIALGSRILRAHDVRGARRTADVMAAVLAARDEASA